MHHTCDRITFPLQSYHRNIRETWLGFVPNCGLHLTICSLVCYLCLFRPVCYFSNHSYLMQTFTTTLLLHKSRSSKRKCKDFNKCTAAIDRKRSSNSQCTIQLTQAKKLVLTFTRTICSSTSFLFCGSFASLSSFVFAWHLSCNFLIRMIHVCHVVIFSDFSLSCWRPKSSNLWRKPPE